MKRIIGCVLIVFLGAALATPLIGLAQDESAPAQATAAGKTDADQSQPTFGLDKLKVLQSEVGGYPLWQYVASFAWVLLAFATAAIVDFLVTRALRQLTARTQTDLDDRLLEVLHWPVKIAVFLLLLNVGIHMFIWPDYMERILSGLFTLAVAATVIYLAMRLVDLLMSYAQTRFFGDDSQMAQLMMPVLSKSLKVFVVIIGALTAAQALGFPIASVVAGLGIGGIAVALAAQSTLANVFGTITLLADRPFRVGDRIQIEGFDGPVETIGLRSTRVRTLDGHLVTIPNSKMADSAINNIQMRPTIKQIFTISLTYDTSPAKMREALDILRKIFKDHPQTHDAWVYWKDYGPSSLDILVIFWCKSTVYAEFLAALEEINLKIKEQLEAAGLDFAFPTQTIHLHEANIRSRP